VSNLVTRYSQNVDADSYISPAASAGSNDLPAPLPTSGELPLAGSEEVTDIVSHLQLVSMSQIAQRLVGVDDLVFKTESIRAIPHAPTILAHLGKPTTCIWLPTRDEAKELLDYYSMTIGHIQHVIHHPSLPSMISDVYEQIEGAIPLKSGHVVLLLSIIASVTHMWLPNNETRGEHTLFLSPTQANAQTPLWIRAAQRVLHAAQNAGTAQLEMIQGIIILGCVVCNVEGLSLRYRSLHSTGLLLGRELGLHRMDRDPNTSPNFSIKAEMGRRVWWYLAATDW
jgi:hypothetical protein